MQGKQDTGQTGIFILAVISYSVGLITKEIVQRLIRFSKETIGIGRENDFKNENKNAPEIIYTIDISKNPVSKEMNKT
jgi:hypothetical protein